MTDNRIEKIRAGIKRLKSQLLRGACSSQIAMETRCKEEAYNEVLALLTMQEEPNITGIKSKHATGKLKECIDNAKKAKLNAMLDESLSKETKESWNERIGKKESVSEEWIEELRTKLNLLSKEDFKKVFDKYAIDFNEEPVSEDLEEEIENYLKVSLAVKFPTTDIESIKADVRYIARHFANWQREQMEKNRIAHCNSITNEQAELEDGFVSSHIDKNNCMPTFLDAIEYGMRLQKEQIEEALLSEVLPCFMHGGEADEVVAKLDEVLSQKK